MGRHQADLQQRVDVEPAPVALVRDGRVEEPVAQHDLALLERGRDHVGDVLRARGVQQHHLGDRLDAQRRVQEYRP